MIGDGINMFLELAYQYLKTQLLLLSIQSQSDSFIQGYSKGFVNTVLLINSNEFPHFSKDLMDKLHDELLEYLSGYNIGSDTALKLYQNYYKEIFQNG